MTSDGRGLDGPGSPSAAPAPPASSLAALGSDDWAWLLPHVRRGLHDIDEVDVTPTVRRLAAAPTSRLAGGRVRRELEAVLAAGGPPWQATVARVRRADLVPEPVARLLAGDATAAASADPDPAPAPPAVDTGAVDRLRERLRTAREERDELRRQLAGATTRAERAEAASADARDELRAALARIDELEEAAARASAERTRAVERERRRRDAEVAALREQLAAMRRADDERRRERRRRQERAEQEAEARRAAERRRAPRERRLRLVPGRPSQLPDDVRPGTTEHALLLLHRGRQVHVDGYNVTRQHRADLGLEEQRAWLVRLLGTLAARRQVRPTVVFDGQQAGGSRPAGGAREVTVRFTAAGVTADDELVLAAEATDEPITAVTDDRELRDRLRALGVDVIGSTSFLDAAR